MSAPHKQRLCFQRQEKAIASWSPSQPPLPPTKHDQLGFRPSENDEWVNLGQRWLRLIKSPKEQNWKHWRWDGFGENNGNLSHTCVLCPGVGLWEKLDTGHSLEDRSQGLCRHIWAQWAGQQVVRTPISEGPGAHSPAMQKILLNSYGRCWKGRQ